MHKLFGYFGVSLIFNSVYVYGTRCCITLLTVLDFKQSILRLSALHCKSQRGWSFRLERKSIFKNYTTSSIQLITRHRAYSSLHDIEHTAHYTTSSIQLITRHRAYSSLHDIEHTAHYTTSSIQLITRHRAYSSLHDIEHTAHYTTSSIQLITRHRAYSSLHDIEHTALAPSHPPPFLDGLV